MQRSAHLCCAAILQCDGYFTTLGIINSDAAAWEAPDFFALAFYLISEEKDTLADMENGQRNQFLSDYLKENFTDRYADSIEAAGLKEDMDAFIRMIHAIYN